MSTTRPGAVALVTAALALTIPAHARAAGAVFGGSTRDGEPISLTADLKAEALSSVVIAWDAKCDDGTTFADDAALTTTEQVAGFTPDYRDLATTRNAKGRFAGVQLAAADLGNQVAGIVVTLTGKLAAARASGTLSAEVTISDKATFNRVQGCHTGKIAWSASRAPGVIYAGKTSQDEPFVARVDAKHKLSQVMLGWMTAHCMTPSFYTFPETLRFPVKSSGGFGDNWSQTYHLNAGGTRRFDYQFKGKLAARTAKGTFHVAMTDADAAGAQTEACDTGAVTWKAATG
jgi:hypothetical protein